jgi:hypothetical protein
MVENQTSAGLGVNELFEHRVVVIEEPCQELHVAATSQLKAPIHY